MKVRGPEPAGQPVCGREIPLHPECVDIVERLVEDHGPQRVRAQRRVRRIDVPDFKPEGNQLNQAGDKQRRAPE